MAETETVNVIPLQSGVAPEPQPRRKKDTRAAARQAKKHSQNNADRDMRRRKRVPAATVADGPPISETQPSVTVAVTRNGVTRSAGTGADVTAYLAAIALAGAAAWFSIRGMVVLFPGAPQSVVAMACAMEGAKLVTAGWLARRWRTTAWIWRGVLVALVAGLAVINAAGVYAQLVAAHVGERGAA